MAIYGHSIGQSMVTRQIWVPLPKSFLRIVAPQQAEIMELGPIFRTVGGRELCPHLAKHVQL